MSTFSGINTALSGLLAYQRAIDIAGQNIANVNTPGFHRQQPVLSERVQGSLPGGVDVLGVQRADAAYVELQLNLSSSDLGRWSAAKGQLEAAQSVLSPGQAQNLGTLLDGFWSSWQGLAAQPDQLGPRTGVQQAASSLATGLRSQYTQLTALQSSINGMLGDDVGKINALANQIADLDTKVHAAEGAGNSTAELLEDRKSVV
jgi:flagellar hook-associated protein 1